MPSINSRPLLLVSVRSELEAAAAIAGGADILDVKDPSRGSLGCPDPAVLKAVCLEAFDRKVRVTTALGEVSEWASQNSFPIPPGVAFAKLGLSNLVDRSDWVEAWREVRRLFNSQRTGMGWVAVAYVDDTAARAPSIDEVVSAAIDSGCAGVLLDTFDKSSGRLFDYLSESQIDELAERMHAAGKFIAAAGRLELSDVARLGQTAVDIVAVRSAVCAKNDRQGAVTTDLVAACKAAIQTRERRLSGAC